MIRVAVVATIGGFAAAAAAVWLTGRAIDRAVTGIFAAASAPPRAA